LAAKVRCLERPEVKKFLKWLLAPWNGVLQRQLSAKRRAILVGCAATLGFFGAFWLFLDGKESLDGRSVLSVLAAPNFRLVSSATREVATFDHNSPYCRIIFERYKPAPIRPGCVNWRRPNLTTSVSPLTSNGYWQGSYKTTISPAYPDLYAGVSRTNAVESIRNDLSLFISALITPGALLLMALMGTATGFRYFRRISGSSDL